MPTRRGLRHSRAGWPWIPKERASTGRIGEHDLRSPEVSAAASKVSAHAPLREVLLPVQRAAAEKARAKGGAVVEGRDIGTVVLPDAELKVYLSAAPEERARRRASQTGREGELDRIRAAIARRDRQDSEREISPLKPAADAVVLDTTSLSLEEVIAKGPRPRHRPSRENVRSAMLFEGRRKPGEMTRRYRLFRRAMTLLCRLLFGYRVHGGRRCLPTDP